VNPDRAGAKSYAVVCLFKIKPGEKLNLRTTQRRENYACFKTGARLFRRKWPPFSPVLTLITRQLEITKSKQQLIAATPVHSRARIAACISLTAYNQAHDEIVFSRFQAQMHSGFLKADWLFSSLFYQFVQFE
jgi:hypothetical protein